MNSERDEEAGRADLRRRAEALRVETKSDLRQMTPEETERLVQELRTHQIELELQNEELRRAQQELTESRDRYADLYEFAPIGYATVDGEGRVLEANLSLAELLAVERRALLGQLFSSVVLDEDQDIWYRHRRRPAGEARSANCTLRLRGGGERTLWAELESLHFEPEDGGERRMRLAVLDVTVRTLAQLERAEIERRMQSMQKLESLGVLAGGVAHDFSNLLAAIQGNAELQMLDSGPDSAAWAGLLEIVKACRRGAELTKQMLAYAGRSQVVVESVDVSRLVAGVVRMLGVSIPKTARLNCKLPTGLPPVETDATQLRQVVMNLVINATEALGDRPGTISIRTDCLSCDRTCLDDIVPPLRDSLEAPLDEGLYVIVEIRDSGCGMDAQTLEKVFQPFFSTKFNGRGLGMAAVLGILRSRRGGLRIQSRPSAGTTVTVYFPANEASSVGRATEPSTSLAPAASRWRGSGTVLLADDEPAIRAVGAKLLEHLGFEALTAADGAEALSVYRERRSSIAIVILDVSMPVMDGIEAFGELRRLDPALKVLFCSGYTEHDLDRFVDRNLHSGYIQKPFSLAELEMALRASLEGGSVDSID